MRTPTADDHRRRPDDVLRGRQRDADRIERRVVSLVERRDDAVDHRERQRQLQRDRHERERLQRDIAPTAVTVNALPDATITAPSSVCASTYGDNATRGLGLRRLLRLDDHRRHDHRRRRHVPDRVQTFRQRSGQPRRHRHQRERLRGLIDARRRRPQRSQAGDHSIRRGLVLQQRRAERAAGLHRVLLEARRRPDRRRLGANIRGHAERHLLRHRLRRHELLGRIRSCFDHRLHDAGRQHQRAEQRLRRHRPTAPSRPAPPRRINGRSRTARSSTGRGRRSSTTPQAHQATSR